MSDVAASINESKRRKDIGELRSDNAAYLRTVWNYNLPSLSVDKYRSEEDKTLTRKIAKFSMHSLNKKSNRLGQKFISKLGISSPVKSFLI